jgi:hypothetical protein
MAGLPIQGLGGVVAEVNANHELEIALNSDETKSGFASLASEVDAGTATATRLVRALEASKDFRLRVSIDTVLFTELFPGTALNSAIWTAPATTATVTVAGGLLTLNAGASTASGAVARVSSYRSFTFKGTSVLWFECTLQFAQLPQANNVSEWGFGIATGTTAPTAGAFFRYFADGSFKGVYIDSAGVEQVTPALSAASLVGTNTTRHFIVGISDDDVTFWIDNVLVGIVPRVAAAGAVMAVQSLPILLRTYNTGATSAAQVMKVGLVDVSLGDIATNKPWGHQAVGCGDMSCQGPTGGTMGSTALYTNNLAAGTGAAASNTTAALGSGLGGQFSLQPTLAAGTDGIISSYQVPAGTATIPGKSLYITGVKIEGAVTTVLAGGPVIAAWSLAFGHTAVSLATTETVTTKAPRRVPLGIQVFAASAAVGVRDDRSVIADFSAAPIVVQPGEFIQTVLKNLGTATSSGVITFLVSFTGYWE